MQSCPTEEGSTRVHVATELVLAPLQNLERVQAARRRYHGRARVAAIESFSQSCGAARVKIEN